MSFQWTFIAGYLYFEVAIVMIMILPIFSPRRWHQFFKSRIFSMFQQHAAAYFYVFLSVLCLFLIDAIREIRKYSHTLEAGANASLKSDMKGNVKLFRAHRNFYIIGFAIFLAFVIRRLVSMLIIQDELSQRAEVAEATMKEAKNTVLAHAPPVRNADTLTFQEKLQEAEKMLSYHRAQIIKLENQCRYVKHKLSTNEENAINCRTRISE